jgi:hypothetical protein
MLLVENGVRMCASKYNFDAEEAIRMIMSSMESKSSEKKESNKFALPYNGELNGDLCFGISRNNGLYTQCSSSRKSNEAYCTKCGKQALKNEHGLPDYGSIQTRSSKYLKDEEFVDPSGKKPIAFVKIMKKLKLTEEQVREEALKQGLKIDPRHFEVEAKKSGRPKQEKPEKPAKELKAKGRPKKSKKVLELAGEEEDLFASLVMSANEVQSNSVISGTDANVETVIESVVTEEVVSEDADSSLGEVDVVVSANKKVKKTAEKKEAKVAEKKEAKVAEKKEAKVKQTAEEKALLAKQKSEEKALLAKQKSEEKALLAKQKSEEKAAEKAQKKQELAEQKKKPVAEEKKPTKEKKVKESKIDDDDRPSPAFVDPPVDEEADVVKKITFEGKKYLRSKKSGIVYNMEQDVIGKWNEEKQRIDFNEEDDKSDEESEDEYDM